jgi:inner membrane protein
MRLGLKMLLVAVMTLAILVPLAMIRGTIQDRQAYRVQAVDSIARSYAGAQAFTGPVLVVPYVETVEIEEKDAQGVARKVLREQDGRWTFFPESLSISGELKPATRRLGLHEVRVYEWQARADARFEVDIPADADAARPRRIGRPWLGYGIADVRGIIGTPRLRVDGVEVALEQGLGAGDGAGVHARLRTPRAGGPFAFDSRLDFVLGGTESLALVPLGERNRFALSSTWPHPHFGGSFLPRTRSIDAKGFRAEWEVSSLATGARAQYAAGKSVTRASTPCRGRGAAGRKSRGMDSTRSASRWSIRSMSIRRPTAPASTESWSWC